MAFRHNPQMLEELKHLALADVVLVLAFALTMSGGLMGVLAGGASFGLFIAYLPISALAVTLSFVLHELMHKFAAQHYGAVAGFRTSVNGLCITLGTAALGFLLGVPGATVIYASRFTKKEEGIVSLAGPLTNFVVFLAFLSMLYALNPAQESYLYLALVFTMYVSLLLAFFNMLPIYPLDGSKILAWNKPLYLAVLAVIMVLMFFYTSISLLNIVYMLCIALFFSVFYRVRI